MSVFRTESLTPGMSVHADVKDRTGRVLLVAGTTITEKSLLVLKSWGIGAVEVADGSDAQTVTGIAAVEPSALLKARELVSALFVCTDVSHPLLTLLLNIRAARVATERSGDE